MSMKLWELHGLHLDGAIRSTPDGHAEVAGLVLSEKAYLMALRDFRPHQLLDLVRRHGPTTAARKLVGHYAADGRRLVLARSASPEPMVCRSDEATVPVSGAGP
ncbi:MAG: hypothetical protein IT304_08250 [Dehalococcoidia bacterium]|nr:hypothetical protein [Dehalococcoidia bacterium]